MTDSQRAYYEFMGYPAEELSRRYAPYARRFGPGQRVLDVGCGRGEFLQLLSHHGVDGIGIDLDAEMIEEVRRKGLTAEVSDATGYLQSNPSSLDGVFAAHLIEHLLPDDVKSFVHAAVAALKPGGRLLLVTPNPHSLEVQLYEFWTDLQHVRFYTPEIIRWLMHDAGLRALESDENKEYRSGRDVRPVLTQPAQLAPREAPLSIKAGLRQRLAEWLQPASSLERISDLELRSRALQVSIESLHQHFGALFPPGEYFVTGIK